MKKELYLLLVFIAVFIAAYLLPVGNVKFEGALIEALAMVREYARDHVLFCLVPAFFIAGAIANFISQAAVLKYFGAQAKKVFSYSIASISGTILAVCSCTVLPLFASIYKRGAGIGPATAFLYSGPAINVLAIILTARVLGFELGIARVAGAVVFSVVIGLAMHFIFFREENQRERQAQMFIPEEERGERALWKNAVYFAVMIGILVFMNWGKDASMSIWQMIYRLKWAITGILLVTLISMLVVWFRKEELKQWVISTWGFARQILPLLFAGVLIAGFLLGRPGQESLIPAVWIERLVGGNSLRANFFASLAGALMYFATLTEVPILQGLIGAGMGKGPALALLLAGPALSLPNMLVIRSIMGNRKTLCYIALVVIMSTITGMLYGKFFGVH